MIGDDSDLEQDPSTSERLKRYLELVGGSTAILAALGYISLRARLNFLGIGGVAEIELQRLLFEAYSFLISALENLIFFCAPLLFGWAMVAAVHRFYRRSQRAVSAPCVYFSKGLIASAVMLPPVIATATILAVLGRPAAFREAVLVQRLPALAALEQDWFDFPILLLTALALTCWLGSSTVARALGEFAGVGFGQMIRRFSAGLLALLGCMSAIAFSTQFQGLRFQEVAISDSKAGSLECGLLVMATTRDLYLWKAEGTAPGAKGTIVRRPRAPDMRMQLGAVLDVKAFALGPSGDQFCAGRTL